MSRLPAAATSRQPSPSTIAAAAARQAADAMPRESALQDGVLLVLSYEGDNIFVLSNSSYEHVLDSALTNFSSLRKADRSRLRLALQTTIGSTATLVYITPDTWPAVASRAKVVTVLFQRSSPTLSHPSPNPPAKHPPAVTHRIASPVRDSETTSWPGSPPPAHQGTSWHPAYPPPPGAYSTSSGQTPSSPARGTAASRTHTHSRQHSHSGATAPHPYAHLHYLPAPPSIVSPTTDVSFIGVRPLTEAELRQERAGAQHTESTKRQWDQRDDAGSDERPPYGRPAPEAPGVLQIDSTRPRDFSGLNLHQDDTRKPKRSRTWNPPDHQYSCRRCHRTDSPAWRKGPDGPKTLCNACGLSYAKELVRREATASAPTLQPPVSSPPEQPAGYGYPSTPATHTPKSRSARTAGLKTFDGGDAALPTPEGSFSASSGSTAPGVPPLTQPLRECSVCKRTDSPQWRKGPNGPNTLCNSCGLNWARAQRKSEGTHSRPGSSRSPSPTTIVAPTYHQAAPLPRSPNGHVRSSSAGSQRAESPTNADSQSEAP
ncbi:GATA type zinc finger [Ceratobasidium sp. AG-Ba]|nr:GATA type zinc finger [Ceratobasidium sp. AG-Ba]